MAFNTEQDTTFDTLDGVIRDLEHLNKGTESAFLTIGGKLMGFLQVTNSISSALNNLTTQISGEHGSHASAVLARALELCRRMETRTNERTLELGSLRSGAKSVHASYEGFNAFLTNCRLLCALTRIETGRLGGSGTDFGTLTEDVNAIAESIGGKVPNILESSVRLDRCVTRIDGSMAGLSILVRDLEPVMTEVIGSLGLFSERQGSAAALSTELAADAVAVSDSIKQAVISIQFQDITRQQVEHVIEALTHISSEGKQRGPGLSRGATAAITLEASQLLNAEKKFAKSVGRLSQGLEDIAGSVRDMSRSGRGLLHASGDEQDSVFVEIEKCLACVLNMAVTFGEAASSTDAAADELAHTLRSMLSVGDEIREAGSKLFLVALNVNIQAGHIGSAGRPLSVLAAELRDLSMKSRTRSADIATALGSMRATADRLSQKYDDVELARLRSEEQLVIEEMRSTSGELRSWSEASFSQTNDVIALASKLCDDITMARSGFAAGNVFGGVAAQCRESLMQLAAEIGPAVTEDESLGPQLDVSTFVRNYTMESEREVHAALTNSIVSEPAKDVEETDDNFELF